MFLVDMPCALCTVRERRKETLYLLPATSDMGVLLIDVLMEHNIAFEPQANLIALPGSPDEERVVALLRQVLSEPERQAVSVFRSDGREFPRARTLDEWWRIFQTGWFGPALAEDRFTHWFQPIVDTNRHRVLAHECLIRLQTSRIYNGDEIVDAARSHNAVHVFDCYARRLAIRSAARQSRGGVYFVNSLPSSIYNPEHCMKPTMQTLAGSGMNPANIVFEVVEAELNGDPAHLRRVCDHYRKEGFAFALDDIGMSANSLPMICDLRPNYIKLNQSLAQNVEQPMCAATIRKLVELADQFGVTVIAKGVERTQTMENLWLLGVECMQGYLFGRPAPQIGPGQQDLINLAHALERDKVPVTPLLCQA
jgi:EAL domain-containing protein (putative c-di-GMP-specific phosphodiesterase class I)